MANEGIISKAAIILLLILLLSSLYVVVRVQSKLLHKIENFVVYYGSDKIDVISKFDLAILSPLLSKNNIRKLNDQGVITIGYISLTTIGGWEPWVKNVTKDIIIGRYSQWGENIINVSSTKWHKIVLEVAIPYILDKGFRGVFLDNLDMVDRYPWMKNGIINLVKTIRQEYPNVIIIVNRGFTIIDSIAPYIDAVLFECFGTYYDFSSKKYLKWSGGDYEWMINIAQHLRELSERYGLLVLALGYTDLKNNTMLIEYTNYVNNLAKLYGFIPYVAEISLTKINPLYLKKETIKITTPTRTITTRHEITRTVKKTEKSTRPLESESVSSITETKPTPTPNIITCMLIILAIILGVIVVSLIKLKRK